MAISVNWSTKVISVPKSYLTSLGGSRYSLDLNIFRLDIKALEADSQGIIWPDIISHNTEVILSGIAYARTVEIINGYTVDFENGMYSILCVGANHNILDVKTVNSVSLNVGNSAGLISVNTGGGGGGGATASEIWNYSDRTLTSSTGSGGLTTEEHDKLFSLENSTGGGGSIIDLTKKHEEILEKYEKMLLEKLRKAMESLPKTDFSSLLTAINAIKPTDLSGLTGSLVGISLQIKNFGDSMRKHHEEEKIKIEEKYKNEIDKKASLLAENEYNLKEKEKLITELSQKVIDLTEDLEEMQEEKEEEIQIIEDTYLNRIEEVKVETEEEIVEKIIPLLS